MRRIVTEALAAIAGSFALSLAVKVTVVTALALLGTRMARHSRASVRHLVLAATFIVLLAFPFAALIGPSIQVEVPLPEGQPAPAIIIPAADAGATVIDHPAAKTSRAVAERTSLRVSTVIAAAWAAGAALLLLPMAVGLWQLRRIRRFGLPWLQGQTVLRALADEIGVRRPVDVLLLTRFQGQ
jgi:hypothetical protein